MSVREAILGILTIGPTYGHQLLFEIQSRLPHRAHVNPGQVYSTIARLTKSGHIEDAGLTLDNLPTYRLTRVGADEAKAWLSGLADMAAKDWDEVMDVVLLSCTLPSADLATLFARLRQGGAESTGNETSPGAASVVAKEAALVRRAHSIHHASIDSWLSDVEKSVADGEIPPRGLTENRPGRGRRPNGAAVQPD